jgi:multicomponent Na+:H+ antiporter subunit E
MTQSRSQSGVPLANLAPPREGGGSGLAMLRRGFVFLALWVCLIGPGATDFVIGIIAAASAAWTTLALWPSGAGCLSAGIPGYAARFILQSIRAGVEVAKYAFARDVDLKPGFTSYQTCLPSGMRREALCTIMSLQPGKLPVRTAPDGIIHVHCLNMRHSATAELREDEATFLKVLKPEPAHG